MLLEKFPKLKKIDVYKSSSNVLGSYMNPDYSNTSIPYIFLFDADKIYSLNQDKNNDGITKMQLLNSNPKLYTLPDGKGKEHDIKVNTLISKYKKGFNKKYRDKMDNITRLQKLNNKIFTFNKSSFLINESSIYFKGLEDLRTYLLEKNIVFIHTTIEEVLINKKSKLTFYNWLNNEYDINIEDFLYDKREVLYSRSYYKQRKGIGNILFLNPKKIFNKKIIYKKMKYTKEVSEFLIDYIRVIYFDGKFELLNNKIFNNDFGFSDTKEAKAFKNMKKQMYKNLKNFGIKSQSQCDKLENIFNSYKDMTDNDNNINKTINIAIEKLNLSKQKKTNGWATKFLNFAISEIDSNLQKSKFNQEKEFRKEFKNNFGEFYDIITTIENKL